MLFTALVMVKRAAITLTLNFFIKNLAMMITVEKNSKNIIWDY